MRSQPPDIERVAAELRHGLLHLYGPRLHGVYLFGSYARGDQDDESDLDVLIVLDRVERYGAEIDRTSALVAGLSLDRGMSISRVFASRDAWEQGDSAFLRSVREHAVRV